MATRKNNKPSRGKKDSRKTGQRPGLKKPSPAGLPQHDVDLHKPVRLNRYLAHAGICSRREADDLIKAGVVTVNGKQVTGLGTKVMRDDDVRFDGRRVNMEKKVYLLLNKPKDYITTMKDPKGRRTVMSLVKNATSARVFPVGRLDRNTLGLLLFTNDGELTTRLTHPKHGIKKIYHAQLDKNVNRAHLEALLQGVELEDGPARADAVDFVGDGSDQKQVGIELHIGKNRIVRRMFEHFGYKVIRLDRVYFAGLTKKNLPRGRNRHLSEREVAMLKMTAGKK